MSAGDAAVYAEPNDVGLYARAIVELLDDEPRRRSMGAVGRARIESELAWRHQRAAYVGVYDRVAEPRSSGGDSTSRPVAFRSRLTRVRDRGLLPAAGRRASRERR